MSKHVVLLPTGEIYGHFPQANGTRIAGQAKRLQEDVSLPALVQEAHTRGWSHIWCYGSWEQPSNIVEQIEQCQEAGFKMFPNWQRRIKKNLPVSKKENMLRSVYAYKKIEGKYTPAFYIVFLERGEKQKTWPFYDPQESSVCAFLDYIDQVENLIAMPIGSTPASTGILLLDRIWSKDVDSHVLAKPTNIELEKSPFARSQAALVWQRQLTREELYKPVFLVGYDKNSAFPRAAKDARIGVGDVTYLTENITFDHLVPGIWRISLLPQRWQKDRIFTVEQKKIQTLFDAGMIDLPYWNVGHDIWLGTPLVKYMQQQGFAFTIEEAYVFDKKLTRYVYRPLVDLVWELRSRYPATHPLNPTFKAIVNSIIGITRSSKLGTDAQHYRPDHSTQILALARSLMLINICKYAPEYIPFLVATDALFYLTGPEGVPGMLDHSDSLGGYKLIVKIPVTDDLLTILQQPEDVLKFTDKLAYIHLQQEKANRLARL